MNRFVIPVFSRRTSRGDVPDGPAGIGTDRAEPRRGAGRRSSIPARRRTMPTPCLMFNVYDTLVLPNQGEAGLQPASRREAGRSTATTSSSRCARTSPSRSGNMMTAEDVGVLLRAHERPWARACRSCSRMSPASRRSTSIPSASISTNPISGPSLPRSVRLPILDKAADHGQSRRG